MTAKKIGANLSVTIDDVRHGKKVTKDESTTILGYVKNYNDAVEKNRSEATLKKWKSKIEGLMVKNTKKAETKATAAKAAIKKVTKKATKAAGKATKAAKAAKKVETNLLKELKAKVSKDTLNEDEIQEMERLLKQAKAAAKVPSTTGKRFSGEH
jgi:uncharacterized membrane protein YfhO